ncbi:hypothetical protein DFH09DRAFT_1334011 [Mycena vulgaris]|nr:hypothetical protein DFH09DRAFT_1334011 [Mycena vulgaris]
MASSRHTTAGPRPARAACAPRTRMRVSFSACGCAIVASGEQDNDGRTRRPSIANPAPLPVLVVTRICPHTAHAVPRRMPHPRRHHRIPLCGLHPAKTWAQVPPHPALTHPACPASLVPDTCILACPLPPPPPALFPLECPPPSQSPSRRRTRAPLAAAPAALRLPPLTAAPAPPHVEYPLTPALPLLST